MDNNKIPIGLVLKDLAKEKKVAAAEIAGKLNLTRQAIYDTYSKRTSMTTEELDSWSEILGVSVQEILYRSNKNLNKSQGKSYESMNFGNDVVEKIEDHFRKLEEFYHEQLRAKDQQIEKLLSLLGKPKGCPNVATLYQLRVLKNRKGLQNRPIFLNRGYKFGYTPTYL